MKSSNLRENSSGHATFSFKKLLRFDGKTCQFSSSFDVLNVLSIHAVLLLSILHINNLNFFLNLDGGGEHVFLLGPPTRIIDIPMVSIKEFDFKHKTVVFDKKP